LLKEKAKDKGRWTLKKTHNRSFDPFPVAIPPRLCSFFVVIPLLLAFAKSKSKRQDDNNKKRGAVFLLFLISKIGD